MKNLIWILCVYFLFGNALFAQVSISATSQNSICSANGSISVNMSGGTAPFKVVLDGVEKATTSANLYTITGLSSGNYQLQVVDNAGSMSNSLTVNVGGNYIEPSLTGTYANCQISVNVSDGRAPYQYAMSSGTASGPFGTYQSSNVFANVPITNTCYIRVKDACDNIYTAAIAVQTNYLYISPSCSVVDSVTYNLSLAGAGGIPPYTFTCSTPANPSQTNATGIFNNLHGCQYTAIITDNCGHSYSMQSHSCLQPKLSLDCINCTNGTVEISATGGIPPYTFSIGAGGGNSYSNNTGIFTGIAAPDNGLFYECSVDDACAGYWGATRFYCLDASISCQDSIFNGQVDFHIDPKYLMFNPKFPIALSCNNCVPATVSITSASQLPVHFDGLMAGFQQISMTDNCNNVYNIVSDCDLYYEIEMIFLAPPPGSGNGTPLPGSGQATSCGNTLKIHCASPTITIELYTLPSNTFYGSSNTGIFPFILPAIYEIRFVSPTGFVVKKDTFDTSLYFTKFTKDCRTLFAGACPSGLIFDLYDKSGNAVEINNTSGIFANLLPGKWYRIFAKDTLAPKSISKWILMDSIGRLKYDILNCQNLEASLILPQSAKGDTIPTYTLTGANTAYFQQNQTGSFPSLANDSYTLKVTRGNCDTLVRTFIIGAPFTPKFCVAIAKNLAGDFSWTIKTDAPPNAPYILLDANGNAIPPSSTNFYAYLPVGNYTFASANCEMAGFQLPHFPDSLLTAHISSYCSNLACIEAQGAMSYTDWQNFGISHNLSICYPPQDFYYLYKNGLLSVASSVGTFCNLTSGGNYKVVLVRLGTAIDSVNLYVPPYQQPNLDGTNGFVCAGLTSADINLTLTGNGAPFTYNLLNPPAGYTPSQIISNNSSVIFPNLPIGLYDFMVYDACGASSDFSAMVTELGFVPSWIRYCDGTIQLFAPNYSNWEYTWTNAEGVTIGTTYNPLVINPNAATYTITVQVGSCTFSANVSVPAQNSVPIGVVTDAGPDAQVPYSYLATSASTYLQGNLPTANETVQWLQALPKPSNALISTPFQANTQITVSAPGIYTFVYLIHHELCIGVDTVRINFFDCGKYEIEVVPTPEGCRKTTNDGSATISVTGGTGPYLYTWSTGMVGETCTNLGSGNYSVSVSAESGCLFNNSPSINVPFYVPFSSEKVEARFWSIADNSKPILLERDTIHFFNSSLNANTYSWNFDYFGTSTEENPIQILEDTGMWKITLYAANEYCADTYSQFYHIIPNGTIFIASAFTPNGDNVNDTFAPIGVHIVELDFTIYDRWGTVVFYTRDTDSAWDGRSEGRSVPEGVYTYIFHALLESGKRVQQAGTVTLVR